MSRGRAKAKQTKVARELKYSSHEPNFNQLQRELSTGSGYPGDSHDDDAERGGGREGDEDAASRSR